MEGISRRSETDTIEKRSYEQNVKVFEFYFLWIYRISRQNTYALVLDPLGTSMDKTGGKKSSREVIFIAYVGGNNVLCCSGSSRDKERQIELTYVLEVKMVAHCMWKVGKQEEAEKLQASNLSEWL